MYRFLYLSFSAFSGASDLLFMNLCNKGKQPALEAITHIGQKSTLFTLYTIQTWVLIWFKARCVNLHGAHGANDSLKCETLK